MMVFLRFAASSLDGLPPLLRSHVVPSPHLVLGWTVVLHDVGYHGLPVEGGLVNGLSPGFQHHQRDK